MTLKNIVIILVLAAGAYFAYVNFVPQETVNEAVEGAKPDHYTKGATAFTGGMWDQVIEHYTAALADEPGDKRSVEAEKRIARALEKNKETTKAIAAYKAFIAKHPNDPKTQKFKARVEQMEQLQ